MNAGAKTLLPIGSQESMEFVSSHSEATIFHHPRWVDVISRAYGYQTYLLAMRRDAGQARGYIPLVMIGGLVTRRRAASLPFSDFCRPILGSECTLDELASAIHDWRRQVGLREVEVRWSLPAQKGIYPGATFARHSTRLIENPEELFGKFKKTQVQQRIRKAERQGVEIRWAESREDMLLFYGMHLKNRRRLGVPVQPLRFFDLLWERLISQGLGFVLLSYQHDRLLAGAVFLHFKHTLTYKFSASDPAALHLRPNNLLLWHAIRWGCENGFEEFDWGRTDLANAGLRAFKSGWASEESIVHYSVFADAAPKPVMAGRLRNVLRVVIQACPTWVCRGIGELFYGLAG